MLHTYIQIDRHTDPLTKWDVEELSLLKIIVVFFTHNIRTYKMQRL